MKVTFAAGAELGMRCLTNIEYGSCLSGGNEPSSWTRVKGTALKWGRGTRHPKAPRSGKKQGPIDCWQRIAISPTIPVVNVNALVLVETRNQSSNFREFQRLRQTN